MTSDPRNNPNAEVIASLNQVIAGYKRSAEAWSPHLLYDGALGECARRRYLECLAMVWRAEEQLAALTGDHN